MSRTRFVAGPLSHVDLNASLDETEGLTIASGYVDGAGHLILVRVNGGTLDCGPVGGGTPSGTAWLASSTSILASSTSVLASAA